MIQKTVYNMIAQMWDKSEKIYAKYENIKDRLSLLDQYLYSFIGKDVIEIGSNAGIAAFSIAQVAKSYVGIEPDEHYVKQAEITKRYVENKDRVTFLLGKIADVKTDFNALFASYSLYHLSNEEVEYLIKEILPKCKTVVVINRANVRRIDKNKWQLWYYKNTIRLLQSGGFETTFKWGNKKKSFYLVFGVRNG